MEAVAQAVTVVRLWDGLMVPPVQDAMAKTAAVLKHPTHRVVYADTDTTDAFADATNPEDPEETVQVDW